jgi:DNA-binding transcriptional ArsR family regulator
MPGDPDIAAVAAVIGEPTRARILMALLDGLRLPASELTRICGTAKSTTSEHLRMLSEHGFVTSEKCGRHTYYWLADPGVAHALEAMAGIAPRTSPTSLNTVRRHDALARARLCYDHLAGHLGVTVTDALSRTGLLHPSSGGQLLVDSRAWDFQQPLGITTTAVAGRRQLARGCVDWTARRHHLAGALGAALAERMFRQGWITRPDAGQRAIALTDDGKTGIISTFGIPEAELADVPCR